MCQNVRVFSAIMDSVTAAAAQSGENTHAHTIYINNISLYRAPKIFNNIGET